MTRHRPAPERSGVPVAAWAATFALSAALFLSVVFWWDSWWNPVGRGLRVFPVWAGAVTLSIFSGGVVAWRLWRIAGRSEKGSRAHRNLELAALVIGLVVLGITAAFVSNARFLNQVDLERRAFAKYALAVDDAGRTVTIDGIIGPGIASRFRRILETHPGIDTVAISSVGGLTDQALALAEAIGNIPDATVVATRRCDSSCIIVLMAGERREAGRGLELGFHAASSIVSADFGRWDILRQKRSVDNYLLERGMPPELTFQSFPGGALTPVPAIRLAGMGIVHRLVDGKDEVPIKVAKWRKVEDVLAAGGPAHLRENLVPLLRAIRDASPPTVELEAGPLYDSYTRKDPEALGAGIGRLVLNTIPRAILAADDAAVNGYHRAQLRQIAHLIETGRWDECAMYIAGDVPFDRMDAASRRNVGLEYAALERVIRSAGKEGWQPVPIPPGAELLEQEAVRQAAEQMLAVGLNPRAIGTDNRIGCAFAHARLRAILGLDARDAAAVLRRSHSEGEAAAPRAGGPGKAPQ